MTGKTAAAIISILSVVNIFALFWYLILKMKGEPALGLILFGFIASVVMIIFSAAALSEKEK